MIDQDKFFQIEIFRHASVKELELLTKSATVKSVSPGQTIVYEGEESNHVYFILAGVCLVQLKGKVGKEIILKELQTGDCFGELGAFCKAKRCASILAMNPTSVLVVSAEAYVSYCNTNIKAAQMSINKLARSLAKITRDFQSLAMDDLNHRVIRLLLELSVKEKNKLFVRLTHGQLANRVAATRESVSRVISTLRKSGLIRTDEHEIEIDESLIELYSQL